MECKECAALIHCGEIQDCLLEQNVMPELEAAARSRICLADVFNWL